jgi:hypothetical protein
LLRDAQEELREMAKADPVAARKLQLVNRQLLQFSELLSEEK